MVGVVGVSAAILVRIAVAVGVVGVVGESVGVVGESVAVGVDVVGVTVGVFAKLSGYASLEDLSD